jgi:hypothetical protein
MKFEFGDLYKFVVSLGVVLISLSVLAPWLFLKEPFDLFRTEVELRAVTEVARAAIIDRQQSVAFILRFIPWFSMIGSVCGIALIYLGLKRWHANQLLLDEQAKLEVAIKKQSLRDATKDEIETNAAKEFQALAVQESATEDYKFNSFQASYLQLERQVAKRLSDVYGSKYEIEANKMVGGAEIDLLLRGKTKLTKDVVVEVKSIRKGFNFGWLRESFLKNIYTSNIYSQVTNRIPNTLLLIITEFQGETPDKYASLLAKIAEDEHARKGKDCVVMLSKDELHRLSPDELQERLSIYA